MRVPTDLRQMAGYSGLVAAARLAISERKLWELQNAGKIPVVREGRMVRYLVSDLDEWISARRSGGQT